MLGAAPAAVKTAWAAQDERDGLREARPVSGPALRDALLAAAAGGRVPVKVGMLAGAGQVSLVAGILRGREGFACADPVMGPSAGGRWADRKWVEAFRAEMPGSVDLITPNLAEARELAGIEGGTAEECADALAGTGFAGIAVTGCEGEGGTCADLVRIDGRTAWLAGRRIDGAARGTGCTHSTTACAAVALGESPEDAVVIGRMQAAAKVAGRMDGWPSMEFLPALADSPVAFPPPKPADTTHPRGVCPLVDDPARIDGLAGTGVSSVQLRVKDLSDSEAAAAVRDAAIRATKAGLALFVNDHWRACCEVGGDAIAGVHLGQEDLGGADLAAIRARGLSMGITANGWAEAAAAMAAGPSYVSFGPVHPTRSKETAKRPVGAARLRLLCRGLAVPALAIGGVNPENVAEVAASGVRGVAAIGACSTPDATRRLVAAWEEEAAQR